MESSEPAPAVRPHQASGLTLRSFVVTLVALLLMGVWIQYEELINTYGGPLAENSPPNSAIGVFLLVLGIGVLLQRFRRRLRLSSPELVVVYTALALAAPLMTQGLWHRLFGLVAAIPHNQDFRSYDSLPTVLWPHGPNLVANGQFRHGLDGFEANTAGPVAWTDIDRGTRGAWHSPVLRNPAGDPAAESSLTIRIPRHAPDGREVLVPGENHLLAALVRPEGLTRQSAFFVRMQADDQEAVEVLRGNETTQPTFDEPGGFRRVGTSPVAVPTSLRESLSLTIGLRGEGALAVQDLQFLNIEAVSSAFSGRSHVREDRLHRLPDGERNATDVRPRRWYSPKGLAYLLQGRIPLRQWAWPAAAWSTLVAGLFAGLFGLNLIMRRQWADHERFTFPLTILPARLMETATDAHGRRYLPILRQRALWIGFGVTLPLVLLKGLHFYHPAVPAPVFSSSSFASYVESPILKAFLDNVGVGLGTGIGFPFCIFAIALLIETDVLFSLWSMFLLFRFWHLFGKLFGLERYAGYPWDFQQVMGGFIFYALMAVVVARQHLARVGRLVVGRERGAQGEAGEYRLALGLVLSSLLTLGVWGLWTRMGVSASLLFFGYMLVCGFAASKIRAECGAPFGYLTPYYGMQFVAAIGGFAVFKSTGMLVATIAAGFMCTSCFLLIAPVQVEMLELGRRFQVRSRDVGAGLTLGLLGGLLIGGFVVLAWAYGQGANNLRTSWPYEQNWYFGQFRTGLANADRAILGDAAAAASTARALDIVSNPNAKGLAIGAAATGIVTLLRARVPGFPFHPLGYVLAPTHFMQGTWLVLLVAWVTRILLLRIGGVRMIRHGLVPFCIGMFLACILSIVVFDGVGLYLRSQGVTEVYSALP